MVSDPSITVQFRSELIFPSCMIPFPAFPLKWQILGHGPLHGTHSPLTVFLLGGQTLTHAPLSFNKCLGLKKERKKISWNQNIISIGENEKVNYY